MFETVLQRCLDIVDVGGETSKGIFEAVAVLSAPDVQLLPVLGDLLLRLRGEGVHQLLQHTELFAAERKEMYTIRQWIVKIDRFKYLST